MRKEILKPDNNVSPFLGLFEGKKKEREAEIKRKEEAAKLAAALALEKAKQDSFRLELEAAKIGYEPDKETRLTTAKTESDEILYIVLVAVVVVVMAGLYFIKKR